jgi:tetrahydromethanopterin S-methyltransferase subunit B
MQSFSEIVEKIKKLKALSNDYEVADIILIKPKTLAVNKTRNSIPFQEITAFCNKEHISLNWLLSGIGPQALPDEKEASAGETKPSDPILRETATPYSSRPSHPAAVLMPPPDNTGPPGIDPSIQAMSDIKEIFDSGDPILIPAIQANLNAFKRALLRERQFAQVIQENRELKERIVKLEKIIERIPELEAKIERLQTENNALKEKINTLAGRHGGCPPTALGMEHAARTGTDDQAT